MSKRTPFEVEWLYRSRRGTNGVIRIRADSRMADYLLVRHRTQGQADEFTLHKLEEQRGISSVYLVRPGDSPYCQCEGFRRGHLCRHIKALREIQAQADPIAKARTRTVKPCCPVPVMPGSIGA